MSTNAAAPAAENQEDVVKKHTLESDEEDDGQEYDRLDEDDIEGRVLPNHDKDTAQAG